MNNMPSRSLFEVISSFVCLTVSFYLIQSKLPLQPIEGNNPNVKGQLHSLKYCLTTDTKEFSKNLFWKLI